MQKMLFVPLEHCIMARNSRYRTDRYVGRRRSVGKIKKQMALLLFSKDLKSYVFKYYINALLRK